MCVFPKAVYIYADNIVPQRKENSTKNLYSLLLFYLVPAVQSRNGSWHLAFTEDTNQTKPKTKL